MKDYMKKHWIKRFRKYPIDDFRGVGNDRITNYSNQAHYRKAVETIIENMPIDVKTILDAGCGNGYYAERLSGKYQVTNLDFLDYYGIAGVVGDITNPEFSLPNKYDLILCLNVEQHLIGDQEHENAIRFLLKHSRYVFITSFLFSRKFSRYERARDIRFYEYLHIYRIVPFMDKFLIMAQNETR